MREGTYLEIPGSKMHELPPLLIHASHNEPANESEMLASVLSEAEEMLSGSTADDEAEQQRMFTVFPLRLCHVLGAWTGFEFFAVPVDARQPRGRQAALQAGRDKDRVPLDILVW